MAARGGGRRCMERGLKGWKHLYDVYGRITGRSVKKREHQKDWTSVVGSG
jgi:hypothetical protein